MSRTDKQKKGALKICAVLRKSGFEALFAGGYVRDCLLGRKAGDIDIATNARPEEVASLFPRSVAIGAAFGVIMVIENKIPYEVATFRCDGVYEDGRRPLSVQFVDAKEDALRRDFTINALFMDPESEKIIDYVGGQQDLEKGIVRTVGEARQRFAEDRLRMLRAVRFSASLDFSMDEACLSAIQDMAPQIHGISSERICEEMNKILVSGRARPALELLDNTGLLRELFPEINAMKGVEQPPQFHPEGDVFQHTLLALEQLPEGVSFTLAMAALLHDVGKPVTQTIEDRIRFTRHEHEGSRMADRICKGLRISNRKRNAIVWLVKNHMRLKDFMKMRPAKQLRYMADPGFEELLELGRIDALASNKDTSLISDIKKHVEELRAMQDKQALIINGHDLIQQGYAPGNHFRELLSQVENELVEGKFKTKEEALAYLLQHFPPPLGKK
ncbi:MAG: CCA tRNA nucleotidyltransferase [Candidatus Hydrogenedentales bacterium]